MMLPVAHQAASRITLSQPRDTVWAVVRNLGNHDRWWPDVAAMEQLEGEGERWVQIDDGGGRMPLRVMVDIPPTQFITEILDAGLPFGGTWTYDVVPAGDGTTVVTVTEEGYIYQPFFRVASVVIGHHRTMDRFLVALGEVFGEDVTPVHLY
jgi:hypothetical protein